MDEKQTPRIDLTCTLNEGGGVIVEAPHSEATDTPEPSPSLADIFQAAVGKNS